jgi:hypothetical protein
VRRKLRPASRLATNKIDYYRQSKKEKKYFDFWESSGCFISPPSPASFVKKSTN